MVELGEVIYGRLVPNVEAELEHKGWTREPTSGMVIPKGTYLTREQVESIGRQIEKGQISGIVAKEYPTQERAGTYNVQTGVYISPTGVKQSMTAESAQRLGAITTIPPIPTQAEIQAKPQRMKEELTIQQPEIIQQELQQVISPKTYNLPKEFYIPAYQSPRATIIIPPTYKEIKIGEKKVPMSFLPQEQFENIFGKDIGGYYLGSTRKFPSFQLAPIVPETAAKSTIMHEAGHYLIAYDINKIPEKTKAELFKEGGRALGIKYIGNIPYSASEHLTEGLAIAQSWLLQGGIKAKIIKKVMPETVKYIESSKIKSGGISAPAYELTTKLPIVTTQPQFDVKGYLETMGSEIRRYRQAGFTQGEAQKLAEYSYQTGTTPSKEFARANIQGILRTPEIKLADVSFAKTLFPDTRLFSKAPTFQEYIESKSERTGQKINIFLGKHGVSNILTTPVVKMRITDVGKWIFFSPAFKEMRVGKKIKQTSGLQFAPEEDATKVEKAKSFIEKVRSDLVQRRAGYEQINYLNELAKRVDKTNPEQVKAFRNLVQNLYEEGTFKGITPDFYNTPPRVPRVSTFEIEVLIPNLNKMTSSEIPTAASVFFTPSKSRLYLPPKETMFFGEQPKIEEKIVLLPKEIPISKNILGLGKIEKSKRIEKLKQPEILKQPQVLKQPQILKQPSVQKQPQVQKQMQKQFQRQVQKQMQKQFQRQVQKQIPRQIQKPRIDIPELYWLPSGAESLKSAARKLLAGKSYEVFKIVKKKPIRIVGGVTKEQALDIGTREILKDLRATFGVRETTEPLKPMTTAGEFRKYAQLLRLPLPKSPYRKFGEVYIQKERRVGRFGGRLAFRGEKLEIQKARKQKLNLKGGRKWL